MGCNLYNIKGIARNHPFLKEKKCTGKFSHKSALYSSTVSHKQRLQSVSTHAIVFLAHISFLRRNAGLMWKTLKRQHPTCPSAGKKQNQRTMKSWCRTLIDFPLLCLSWMASWFIPLQSADLPLIAGQILFWWCIFVIFQCVKAIVLQYSNCVFRNSDEVVSV